MKFWETNTFRNALIAGAVTTLGFLARDVADGFMADDYKDYALVWIGVAVGVLNRARKDDVDGFPTFGPGQPPK
jgi:hypothetical protein